MSSHPFVVGIALFTSVGAANPDDTVTLLNGDRLTGEVKSLERGKLRFTTDDLGTVEIEWDKVAQVVAVEQFEVDLTSGVTFVGTLRPATEPGHVVVSDGADTQTIALAAVVRLTQVESSFRARWSGGGSLGFSFATATQLTQWSGSAHADYRAESYGGHVEVSSILSSQEDGGATTRNSLGAQVSRSLPHRWFVGWLVQLEQNEELGLEFRSLLGAGLGRHLVQNNQSIIAVIGALGYTRERFRAETEIRHSLESVAGLRYELFLFDDPEIDISSRFFVIPSLSNPGRLRAEIKSDLRMGLFSDFSLGVQLVESFDSRPGELSSKNDFAIFTTLGWTF